MRLQSWIGLITVSLGAAACQGGGRSSASVSDDLKRDLEAASSDQGLQLANASQGFERARVVSDIEQSNHSAPTTQLPRPKPVPRKRSGALESTNQSPSPEPQVAEAPQNPQPEATEQAPAADEPRVPSVAPRPAPVPVEVAGASNGGRGRVGDGPPEIGEVIGVIFRGGGRGGIDDDHCVPRRRPGARGFPFPLPFEQVRQVVSPLMRATR